MSEPKKNDQGKLRWSLLPIDSARAIVKILEFGAEKYGAYNWCSPPGFTWSRVYDALQRHLTAWFEGEDVDPESGQNHLAHAGCNILFLLSHQLRNLGNDDRYKMQIAYLDQLTTVKPRYTYESHLEFCKSHGLTPFSKDYFNEVMNKINYYDN